MGTVREDVVKVSFDVNDKPLQKVDSGINKLVQSTQKMAGAGGVGRMTQGFDKVAKSANSLAKTDFAGKITAGIEEFNARASITQDKLAAVGRAAQAIAHPIKTSKAAFQALDQKVLGVQMSAGRAVAQFKTMAATKLTGVQSNLLNIKNALTQGQTGAKGFVTAFKNIGKVSIVGVANGARNLATNLKSAAAAGVTKLASGLKSVGKASLNSVVGGVKKLGSGLVSALSTAGKLAVKLGSFAVKGLAVGIGAAATAIGALGAASIKGYAEYEQLVGGVDTLFKDSSKQVQQYANNAYKAAGLSANAYMETVTSFSASMLQSLGGDTAAAAAASNQAVVDMADNANKMGTSMADIQNAYQGFAKQNYTMLDNLKLGYGGTKEEMQRLLTDAEKLTGKKYDVSNFADITEAIHAIQTEMGITGTTAKEASSTIQGSALSMKAAWSNFLTGMADENADFDALVGNLIDSVVTFGQNLIPRIQVLAPRLVEGISQLAQAIVPAIPGVLSSLLPTLASGAMQLVNSLITTLQTNLPQLANMALTIIQQFATFLLQALPQILIVGIQLITTLITGIAQMLPQLVMMALQMIFTLAQGLMQNLPMIIQTAVQIIVGLITGFFQMLPQIIQMGVELIVCLVQGLAQAIPQLLAAIPQIFTAFVEGIMSVDWLQVGLDVITGIGGGLLEGGKSLWNGVKSIFTGGGKESGESAGESMASGLQATAPALNTTASTVASTANSNLGAVANTYSYGAAANANLASGLSSTSYMPMTAAANTESMTDNELAKLANGTSQYGAQAATNLASGLTSNTGTAVNAATSMSSQVESAASTDVTVKVIGDTSSMSAFGSQIAELVASATSTLQQMPEAFTSALQSAMSASESGLSAIDSAFKANLNKLVTATAQSMTQLVGVIRTGMTAITAIVKSVNLYNSGRFIMSGLIRGIKSMVPTLMNLVNDTAKKIKETFDGAMDIGSPSRLMYKSGVFVGQGLALGYESMIPQIASVSQTAANVLPLNRYDPDSSGGTVYHNGGNTENNTAAPVFNLTISGSSDDRATARKVKRWVAEAIDETFASLEYKSRPIREV